MIVYMIINLQTGLAYVGYTKYSLDNRWQQHYKRALTETKNRKFYNAIRKYGSHGWNLLILDSATSAIEAKEKEIIYIKKYDTYYNGYNSTLGGDGNNGIVMSEESNLARSKKLKGRKKSEKTIEKFRQRRQTIKTKEKISSSHLGKKKPWVKWTPEQCRARGLTRRAITKEQYDLVHEYRLNKLTIKEISQLTLLSTDMVKKWLKMPW
jgi:group I intron endonuclease